MAANTKPPRNVWSYPQIERAMITTQVPLALAWTGLLMNDVISEFALNPKYSRYERLPVGLGQSRERFNRTPLASRESERVDLRQSRHLLLEENVVVAVRKLAQVAT